MNILHKRILTFFSSTFMAYMLLWFLHSTLTWFRTGLLFEQFVKKFLSVRAYLRTWSGSYNFLDFLPIFTICSNSWILKHALPAMNLWCSSVAHLPVYFFASLFILFVIELLDIYKIYIWKISVLKLRSIYSLFLYLLRLSNNLI